MAAFLPNVLARIPRTKCVAIPAPATFIANGPKSSVVEMKEATDKVIEKVDGMKDALWIVDYAVDKFSNEDKSSRSFFKPSRLEVLLDVPGHQKEDFRVSIQNTKLYIYGVGKDGLGKALETKKWTILPTNCYLDTEGVFFDTKNGQLKASIPLLEDKTVLKKDAGNTLQ